jgi:hypothetical protein
VVTCTHALRDVFLYPQRNVRIVSERQKSHVTLSFENKKFSTHISTPEAPLSCVAHKSETHCIISALLKRQPPASHRGSLDSCPGQSMWGLWWKRSGTRAGFSLSVSFHRCSVFSRIMWGLGGGGGPSVAAGPHRRSHPLATVQSLYKIMFCVSVDWSKFGTHGVPGDVSIHVFRWLAVVKFVGVLSLFLSYPCKLNI